MAKEYGVFALPAIVFFKPTSKEPVIYAGRISLFGHGTHNIISPLSR